MLAPETRVLLADALRPPDGYRIDVAVGTTYSLNLTALLLAPLSFAFVEQGAGVGVVDPAALLAAVRRYSERTTVFCQAGAIGVPPAYRRVLTFAEGSVHEVAAPQEGRLFHPKVWALRFVAADDVRHRLVVLSRNLTLDRSWDTALVLDEDGDGPVVDPGPAADFVAALPGLALRPVPEDRQRQVASLAESLRTARLEVPAPFDGGELLPLGLGGAPPRPVPERADRLLVVSPFLDAGSVRSAAAVPTRTLVSRPDSFARLGGAALEGWSTAVLSRFAETVDEAVELDDAAVADEAAGDAAVDGTSADTARPRSWVSDGLHAKLVVADVGSRAHLVTGSANFTTAGWGGNVEFSVRLDGPVAQCGVGAVLKDGKGLGTLLEEFPVPDADGLPDPREETEQALEDLHRALAVAGPRVLVGAVEGDVTSFEARLTVPDDAPGRTRVWPITLRPEAHAQPLAERVEWAPVAVAAVTPFLAVETTAGTGAARVTRRCVLKAEVVGDPPERHRDALRDMLRDVEAVVRYLAMLLAEPELGAGAVLGSLVTHDGGPDDAPGWGSHDVVLFEPLVRAAVRDPASVGRIAAMVEELREVGGLLPPEFDAVWDVVQQFVREEVGA